MKTLSRMSYKELETAVIENSLEIRQSKSLAEKRKLIAKGHEIMVEMDRRWNNTKAII